MNNSAHNLYFLSDLAVVSAGYALRTSAEVLPDGDVCMIQQRNILTSGRLDWSDVDRVSIPEKKSQAWLVDGDILFAARSANNFAVTIDSPPEKTLCSPHFFVIRVKEHTLINPHFLSWQMNQRPAQEYFKNMAQGSSMMNIPRAAVESVKIATPTLHNQELIVKMQQALITEKRLLERLIVSRQQQMETIATDLFHNKKGIQHDGKN